MTPFDKKNRSDLSKATKGMALTIKIGHLAESAKYEDDSN